MTNPTGEALAAVRDAPDEAANDDFRSQCIDAITDVIEIHLNPDGIETNQLMREIAGYVLDACPSWQRILDLERQLAARDDNCIDYPRALDHRNNVIDGMAAEIVSLGNQLAAMTLARDSAVGMAKDLGERNEALREALSRAMAAFEMEAHWLSRHPDTQIKTQASDMTAEANFCSQALAAGGDVL